MATQRAPRTARGAAGPGPVTLGIDVGGTGLKAALLDAAGGLACAEVRTNTPYPLPPDALVAAVVALVRPLDAFDRVSVGFPGVVRDGLVLSAPHFVRASGPASRVESDLVRAWDRFDLAAALSGALGAPVRVANDADVQGAAVVRGTGLELVITLGTGVGTALFQSGRLAPHVDFAQHPLRKGETYTEQLGEAARRRIGNRRWNRRVVRAVQTLERVIFYDRLYVGGGNAKHVTADLGPKVTRVDNVAGILGGVHLWVGP